MVDLSPILHMPLQTVIMSPKDDTFLPETDTNPVLKPLLVCTLSIQGPVRCGPILSLPPGSLWPGKSTGSWRVPSNLPEAEGLQTRHLESLLLLSAPLVLIPKTRQSFSAQGFYGLFFKAHVGPSFI